MPINIRARVRQSGNNFKAYYSMLPRDQTLKLLDDMVNNHALFSFNKHFKSVAVDMEDQYLKIVQARHKLFERDVLNERGVDIDLDLGRNIERINWDVNEPETTPARKEELDAHYTDSWGGCGP
jgi:hypothetical protein